MAKKKTKETDPQIELAKEALFRFMKAWKEQDLATMQDYTTETHKRNYSCNVVNRFYEVQPEKYKTESLTKVTDVVVDFKVWIQSKGKGHKIRIRTICEVAPYRADKNGVFGVNPMSIRKI